MKQGYDSNIQRWQAKQNFLSTFYQMLCHLDLKQWGPNSALTLKTNT